jgi:hypothetical protein
MAAIPKRAVVRWEGLEELVGAIGAMKRRAPREIRKMAKKSGWAVLDNYKKNLRGSEPSTAERPLPVGRRTGRLYEGAQIQNKPSAFRDQWTVFNETPYSGWLEFGTSKMVPRRPLQVAVETVSNETPAEMGRVIEDILMWGVRQGGRISGE